MHLVWGNAPQTPDPITLKLSSILTSNPCIRTHPPIVQPPKCEPQRKTEPAKSEESHTSRDRATSHLSPVYMDSTSSHKLTIDPKVPIYNDKHDRIYPDNISS